MDNKLKSDSILHHRKALGFCGMAGAVLWGINFIPAHILSVAGGGSPITALWGAITAPVFFALTTLIVRKFGAVTALYTTYAVLAIPFLVMGPPHPYKPLIAIAVGLTYDFGQHFFGKYKLSGLLIGFTGFTVVSLGLYIWIFRLLQLPGLDKLESGIIYFGLAFLVIGWFMTYLATKVFERLKDHPSIKSLSQ